MTDNVVGTVSVKIKPDTKRFRPEAKRELTKISKQLDCKVKVKLDERSLKVEALKSVRSLNQHLKTSDAYRVKFRAGFTTVGMKGAVAEARRELQAVARTADDVKFKATTASTVITGELDKSGLDQVERDLNRWRDRVSPLKVDVLPTMVLGAGAAVSARLAALTRPRTVQVTPVLSPGAGAALATAIAALSGARSLSNIFSNMWDSIKNLDKAVPIVGTLAEAVANLGSAGLAGASNLFALSSSLAQIAGAGLALPGILGGIAIGVGVTIAALRDFNTVLPEMQAKLSDLQGTISSNFWRNAEAPFRRFIDVTFPVFAAGMSRTATQIGGFFGNLADSANDVLRTALPGMFNDLAESVQIAGRYTDSYLNIIRTLGKVGAGMLPRLAGWVGDIGQQFSQWLSRVERSGELQSFVDGGIAALKDLGSVLGSTASALGGLARAAEAAGGSSLRMLADTMRGVSDAVNSVSFQDNLTNALAAAHEGMQAITSGSGKQFKGLMAELADTLSSVLPTAGRTLGKALGGVFDALTRPSVQSAVIGLFTNLERAVDSLVPALPPVADALGELIDLFGGVVLNVAGALGPALAGLAPKVQSFVRDLKPVVDVLGTVLVNAVKVLTATLGVLPNDLLILGGAFLAFRSVLSKLTGTFTSVTGGFDGIRTGASGLRSSLGQMRSDVSLVASTMATAGARTEREASRMAGAMTRLKGNLATVAPGLAGIGGAALIMGGQAAEGSKGLQGLANIGGGALLGFAAGGPIGAALGAGAGLIGTLASSADNASDSFKTASSAIGEYRDTLNQLSGATTESTRAMAYEKATANELWKETDKLGLSRRTVVDALVGEAAQRNQLTTAIQGNIAELDREIEAQKRAMLSGDESAAISAAAQVKKAEASKARQRAILDEISDIQSETQAVRDAALATVDYGRVLKGLPRKAVTQIETTGIPNSVRGLANLVRRYELTPKQVKTLIEVSGVDASVKQIRGLTDRLGDVDQLAPKVPVTVETKVAEADTAKVHTRVDNLNKLKGVSEVRVKDNATKPLEVVTKKLVTYNQTIVRATVDLIDNATSKINAVRDNLARLNNQRATTYTNHVTSYQTKGKPSAGGLPAGRVTQNTVRQQAIRLGESFTQGLRQEFKGIVRDVGPAETAVLNALDTVNSRVDAEIEARRKAAEQAIRKQYAKDGKETDKERDKRLKALEKALKANDAAHAALGQSAKNAASITRQALIDTGKAIDAVNIKLEVQQTELDNLKTAAREYAAGVKEMIVSSAAISGLGVREIEGERVKATTATLLEDLRKKVAQAQRFAGVIQTLTAQGLNQTTIQQMISAGVEASTDAAEAILSGGGAAIGEINALTNDLNAAGEWLGTSLSDTLYGSAISATQAVVDGLLYDRQKLYDAANMFTTQLGSDLGLGIFQLGSNGRSAMSLAGKAVVDGLIVGIDGQARYIGNVAERAAQILRRSFRNELGIRSPARAFIEDAGYIGKGLIVGLGRMEAPVASAIAALVDSSSRSSLVSAGSTLMGGVLVGMESQYDSIRSSLQEFASSLDGELSAEVDVTSGLRTVQGDNLGRSGDTKVLNYYAAEGSSINAEEDLFAASGRARMSFFN